MSKDDKKEKILKLFKDSVATVDHGQPSINITGNNNVVAGRDVYTINSSDDQSHSTKGKLPDR